MMSLMLSVNRREKGSQGALKDGIFVAALKLTDKEINGEPLVRLDKVLHPVVLEKEKKWPGIWGLRGRRNKV